MASGTITGTTSNDFISCRIVWSSTVTSVANRTSTITASLQYKRTNTGYETYGTGTFSIKIDGTTTSKTATLSITEDGWTTAVTATKEVAHGSDGTKSISISGTGSISGTTLTSTNCSGTAKLDNIAVSSSISSAGSVTLGNNCSVTWTPNGKSYRYKLKFSLGSWSYTTSTIHPNTTSAYTYTGYTIPLSVANQITGSKTGTMTVTMYTYSDSAATKQIGSSSSKTFTVTVPSNSSTKPTINMSLSPVNSLSSDFDGIYIQGRSSVEADFTGSTAKYGATIKSRSININGVGTDSTSPFQLSVGNASGSISVKGTVTDSRGYSESTTQDITVISYEKPKIIPYTGESSIVCGRCDSEGNFISSGTSLRIKAGRKYSTVTANGVQKNFCLLRYRYKMESETSFSSWKSLLDKNITDTNEVDVILENVVSSISTSYIIQIGVVDDIGESAQMEIRVPTDQVTFHLKHGGKGAAFGKYAETDNCLEIDESWKLEVNGVFYANHISALADYSHKDFNELIYQTGYYTGTSAPSAVSCTNYPIDETGVLEVISAMAQNKTTLEWWGFAYQTYRTHTGNMYLRSYYSTTGWTVWKKVTLT